MFKKPRFKIKKSKAQSVIIQFVLFFLMGFGIFVGVGMLFKMRSDIFQGDVATASLKLTSSYLTSTAIASMGCVECDMVESRVTILNTSAGYFTEVVLSGEGIETSTAPSFREHRSSMHNLNESLQLGGSAPSIITMSVVYDRLEGEINITSKYTVPSCMQDGSACVIGEACCNGICEDGVCTSFCDICGAPCSEGGYAYDDGSHTCDGPVNDACNPIIGAYNTCDESGDTNDADCQANCQPGLTYCYSSGNPPFYWGRCVDLQNDDCSCGTCGNVCPDGTSCQDGSCVSTGPTEWWNSNFGYRRPITFTEPQGLARDDEHVRFSVTLSTGREDNADGAVLVCDDLQVPFDGYATSTSGGWITGLEGVAELDFTASEAKSCYLYYDPAYDGTDMVLTTMGWNYVCDADYENCGNPGDVSTADDYGYVTEWNDGSVTCGGDGNTFTINSWCYFKSPYTSTVSFATASDDGSALLSEGVDIVNNRYCQGTTCRSGSSSMEAGRYYALEMDYDENWGDNTIYVVYDWTTCSGSNIAGNYIDTECYPFYGDEWVIETAVGGEESTTGPTDLDGYWKFEEGSGTVVGDSSGNGNDGMLYGDGNEWTDGRIGGGLEFDGNGDYVDIGNPSSLQITGDMTISFWTYPTNIAEHRENPIDKAYCGEFALTQEASGYLSYYQGPNGGEVGGYMHRGWNGIFVNDQWTHIVLVRDVSEHSIRVYKNGIDQGEGGSSWEDPSTSNEPITIGDGYAGAGFHGLIDEVRIYDRTLTQDEIDELYLEGILTGHWEFEEGSGTVVGDSSDNGNDGMLYGDGDEWVTGRIGGGLEFDGSNDYVDLGNDASLGMTEEITIEAWVMSEDIGSRQGIVTTSTGAPRWAVEIRNSKLRFFAYPKDGSDYQLLGNTLLSSDTWYHVVAVYSVSKGYTKVYLNGDGDGSELRSVELGRTLEGVNIGRYEAIGGYFNGIIDNVRIYDAALNDSEVLALYNSAPPLP